MEQQRTACAVPAPTKKGRAVEPVLHAMQRSPLHASASSFVETASPPSCPSPGDLTRAASVMKRLRETPQLRQTTRSSE
eukprot:6191443-Pleurochrysis_carterae.AAC.4